MGKRLVLTAEHGVYVGLNRRACRLRVSLGGRRYDVSGVTVWGDRGRSDRRGIDLATLTLSRPARGHVFELARTRPAAGASVAALGYPFGLPLSLSQGLVTKRRTDFGQPVVAAKIVVVGGNSGGPIVDTRGRAVGVVRGIVDPAGLRSDGITVFGGLDLAGWWGASARSDLCRAHPHAGVPGCDEDADGATTKRPIAVPAP